MLLFASLFVKLWEEDTIFHLHHGSCLLLWGFSSYTCYCYFSFVVYFTFASCLNYVSGKCGHSMMPLEIILSVVCLVVLEQLCLSIHKWDLCVSLFTHYIVFVGFYLLTIILMFVFVKEFLKYTLCYCSAIILPSSEFWWWSLSHSSNASSNSCVCWYI